MRKYRHRQESSTSPKSAVGLEAWGSHGKSPGLTGSGAWAPEGLCHVRSVQSQRRRCAGPVFLLGKMAWLGTGTTRKVTLEIHVDSQVHSWRFSFWRSGVRPQTPDLCIHPPQWEQRLPAAINADGIGVTVCVPFRQLCLFQVPKPIRSSYPSLSLSPGAPNLDHFQAHCKASLPHSREPLTMMKSKVGSGDSQGKWRGNLVLTETRPKLQALLPERASCNQRETLKRSGERPQARCSHIRSSFYNRTCSISGLVRLKA